MKPMSAAIFAAFALLAAPAFAGGFVLDMPTLTWPEPRPDGATRSCAMAVTPAPAPACLPSN